MRAPSSCSRPWSERGRGVAALVASLLVAVVAACSGGADVAGVAEVQDIVVNGAPELPLDETTRLAATVRGADGEPLDGRRLFWSSGDTTIATVDQTGLVTPRAIGQVQIAASADGRSGVFDLRVVRKRVRTIDLVAVTELAVGDTVTVQVNVRAGDGGTVPGVAPSFSSTAPEIASVTADGRVVGRATGTAGIVASADGVADTTTVSVVPPAVASVLVEPSAFELTVGQSLPLRVTLRDRAGTTLTGRAVSYSTSASRVATVDANGSVRAVSAGTATITATSGGRSATARVTVVDPPSPPPPRAPVPARLTITPTIVSLQVGAKQSLTTTLRDSDGDVISGKKVSWKSEAPSIATVNSNGVVTAVAPGLAVIAAESEGITDSAGVTVSVVPIARVEVSPGEASLQVGDTRQLTATPRAASGAALSDRVIGWSSSATSVATVTSNGDVLAVGAGTATITATAEGRQGTATITVSPVPEPPPPPPEPPPPEPPPPEPPPPDPPPPDPPPAEPGPPARVDKVSGDDQRGEEGDRLRDPLVVRIVDASGRPVPGVAVMWVADHGGSVSPVITATDANGLASTQWTLGDREGRQRVHLLVFGVEGVTFSARAEDDD